MLAALLAITLLAEKELLGHQGVQNGNVCITLYLQLMRSLLC